MQPLSWSEEGLTQNRGGLTSREGAMQFADLYCFVNFRRRDFVMQTVVERLCILSIHVLAVLL